MESHDALYADSDDLKADIRLTQEARRLGDELKESDPFEQGNIPEKTNDPDLRELGQLSHILRYYPFMRFFNACARSMYLGEPRGKRMCKFSRHHPIFRRICLFGDLVFVTLCSILIIAAIAYILARFAGIPMPWNYT